MPTAVITPLNFPPVSRHSTITGWFLWNLQQKWRNIKEFSYTAPVCLKLVLFGPRQANLVLIAYASSEGSGEPAHLRSLARTFPARSYKQWVERNLQTENQIPRPSEWLGMRSYNLSWRNARRHKFAWRGSFKSVRLIEPAHEIMILIA